MTRERMHPEDARRETALAIYLHYKGSPSQPYAIELADQFLSTLARTSKTGPEPNADYRVRLEMERADKAEADCRQWADRYEAKRKEWARSLAKWANIIGCGLSTDQPELLIIIDHQLEAGLKSESRAKGLEEAIRLHMRKTKPSVANAADHALWDLVK